MSDSIASAQDRQRLRLRIARHGAAAAFSQLEQIRAFREMALASGLPCLVPGKASPKMSFGPAVCAGYESEAEYVDLYLSAPVAQAEAVAKISAAAKDGFVVLSVKKVPVHFPSLESLMNAAEYEIRGDFGPQAAQSLERFVSCSAIPVVKTKPAGTQECIDARPLIISMALCAPQTLHMVLRFGPGRTLKPERIVCHWLGIDAQSAAAGGLTVLRKQLYWESSEGVLHTP